MKAIDLYSGIGGWSLGLRMAGLRVVSSYERWAPANKTNLKNNHHRPRETDVREMELDELPKGIAAVVGSPPCTQFSFSNRGGNGDIDDGLRDLIRFLEVVEFLRPDAWAMENVPRIAEIVRDELGPRGRLRRFAALGVNARVINAEDFGIPQRRRRCLVGNIDFDLLASYTAAVRAPTLGDVVAALDGNRVVDPLYGIKLRRSQLHDHEIEVPLDADEARINRARKELHPVYNRMPFPDALDRVARTVTATCTRVSRESIIIEQPGRPGQFRRLSVRERACLQGFPITFQFYGSSYAQKLKMIGNAIPPPLAYYVGHAIRRTPSAEIPSLAEGAVAFVPPTSDPPATLPHVSGRHFRADRTFRFAIPSLRLKSGVRFELSNHASERARSWEVGFVFGSSKAIQRLTLSGAVFDRLMIGLDVEDRKRVHPELDALRTFLQDADLMNLQTLWARAGSGATAPFAVLDRLDAAGRRVASALEGREEVAAATIAKAVEAEHGAAAGKMVGLAKLDRNSAIILAGLLIGSLANHEFQRDPPSISRRLRSSRGRPRLSESIPGPS